MGFFKQIDKIFEPAENHVKKQLTYMNMSCYRLIVIDSILWFLFIVYYIGHFFYSKQFTKFEKDHKKYVTVINQKDTIIFTFLCLSFLLYLHYFVLTGKN